MRSTISQPRLWSLIFGTPQIDPTDLAAGIDAELNNRGELDFRTRLLLRDSYLALAKRWGADRLRDQLSAGAQQRIKEILREELGPPGFSTLDGRLMDAIRPQTVIEFLRDLGARLTVSTRLEIGGSIGLILRELLHRGTEDIDAVDEIPAAIRNEHELLNELAGSYGLRLAHFQSHYLPDGWRERLASFGRFGNLDVFLVSEWDIVIGKLFSNRRKDLDDLRMLFRTLSKADAIMRLEDTGRTLRSEPHLLANAQMNWRILFGEELPT